MTSYTQAFTSMTDDDDWDIRPDFKIEMTEKEQRWGSSAIPGSGRIEHMDLQALRENVIKSDKEQKMSSMPKASYGYGGKFDVERDRMDRSAVGHDYHEEPSKHSSQRDCAVGFGGKFGVQGDRQDKCAVGYDDRESPSQHASQKDYSFGFGGKYGVQSDRKDATSADYGDKEAPELHESQKPKTVSQGSTSAASLRAKFEAISKESSVPQERPTRPVGRLPKDVFKPQVDTTAATPVAHQRKPIQLPLAEEPAPTQESLERHSGLVSSVEMSSRAEEPPVTETEPALLEAEPVPEQQLSNITARALYDFTAGQDDELSMNTDDLITNIDKFDELWWYGQIGDRCGIFPANYVCEL